MNEYALIISLPFLFSFVCDDFPVLGINTNSGQLLGCTCFCYLNRTSNILLFSTFLFLYVFLDIIVFIIVFSDDLCDSCYTVYLTICIGFNMCLYNTCSNLWRCLKCSMDLLWEYEMKLQFDNIQSKPENITCNLRRCNTSLNIEWKSENMDWNMFTQTSWSHWHNLWFQTRDVHTQEGTVCFHSNIHFISKCPFWSVVALNKPLFADKFAISIWKVMISQRGVQNLFLLPLSVQKNQLLQL